MLRHVEPVRAHGARAHRLHRVCLVVDPRFPGGTAAAVAEEIKALAGTVALTVCGIETAMFSGRRVNPKLQDALDAVGLKIDWNPAVIRGDIVVFHNPSCLRFNKSLKPRISAQVLYVVCHENFLRPSGAEGFDVAGCLALLERAAVCGRLVLVPVAEGNREGVVAWMRDAGASAWSVAPFDWFNICDLPFIPPTAAPRDRRGRHSRPALEKFPPLEVMRAHFPAHAERCAILGADGWLRDPDRLPRHWQALPFGAMEVGRFLAEIDFLVYFTHPLWRESFGRALAEAIAAGKLVITDPATARTFGPGVVASDGRDVDAIISRFVVDPAAYRRHVEEAQQRLAALDPDRFRALMKRHVLTHGSGWTGAAESRERARARL